MKIRKTDDNRYLFYCEGCEMLHGPTDSWTFNGDFEKPTFSPSILVKGTEMTEKGTADYEAWSAAGYPDRNGEPFESVPTICHSFVTDGKIQFLNDCTHELAGQTVALKDENDWYN
jgi:hypothetical protein